MRRGGDEEQAERGAARGHGGGRRSRRAAGRSWSRGHGGWRRSRIAADQAWSRGHGGEVVEHHVERGAADIVSQRSVNANAKKQKMELYFDGKDHYRFTILSLIK